MLYRQHFNVSKATKSSGGGKMFKKKKEKVLLSENTRALLKKWNVPDSKLLDKFYVEIENEIVQPNETLIYISVTLDIKITDIDAAAGGIVFISDKRVVYAPVPVIKDSTDVVEFKLQDIHSVGSLEKDNRFFMNGHLSFHTSTQQVDFMASHDVAMAEKLRDTLIQAIANVGGNATNDNYIASAENHVECTEKVVRKVLKCKGCYAAIIAFVGEVSQCDYCRTPFSLEDSSINQQQVSIESDNSTNWV